MYHYMLMHGVADSNWCPLLPRHCAHAKREVRRSPAPPKPGGKVSGGGKGGKFAPKGWHLSRGGTGQGQVWAAAQGGRTQRSGTGQRGRGAWGMHAQAGCEVLLCCFGISLPAMARPINMQLLATTAGGRGARCAGERARQQPCTVCIAWQTPGCVSGSVGPSRGRKTILAPPPARVATS